MGSLLGVLKTSCGGVGIACGRGLSGFQVVLDFRIENLVGQKGRYLNFHVFHIPTL